MSEPRIQHVVFDAVGTLVYADPPVASVYYQVGFRSGSRLSINEVRARFLNAFAKTEAIIIESKPTDLRTSEDVEMTRWRQVVAEVFCDLTDTRSCFSELFDHFGRPESWRCFEEVGDTLSQLTRSGIGVSIASNFDSRLNTVCDGIPEIAQVRPRVIASHVGYRKPAVEFFDAVSQQIGVPRDRTLVVGDDRVNDVEAAVKSGFQSLQIIRRGPADRDDQIRSLSELPEPLAATYRTTRAVVTMP